MFKKIYLCAFAWGLAASAALAQGNYPQRPIRMILPFAPGGAGDFVARIIQPHLTKTLGQQVIVENRPGAAGNIGVEMVANATPDGHVILLGNIGAMAINPNLYTKFTVKPLRDCVAVTQLVDVPGSVNVHPALPVKSVAELIAHLKARPGQINFGSAGGGSLTRLETEIFMKDTGTRMVHVPYKGGAGPAVLGLLGNEVQMLFITFTSAISHAKSGRLRMLAVTAPERLSAALDTPTMLELGYKDLANGSWQGLYAPKGTPPGVVHTLFDAAKATMKNADVIKLMNEGGVSVVVSGSPAEYAKFNASENQRFAQMIREAKIEVE